ncbi:hypothetical protein FB451DRAFT_477417 [Mycena latifolia]|nr:hypothetical protein FB451DRAFT_477417 [Mycena latifolia]
MTPAASVEPQTSLSPHKLVEDVIILILGFCDVSSVLAFGQSSKYFHQLASSKNVWLSLTTDLVCQRFIDIRPGEILSDLSTEELVDRIRRTTLGPQTWALDYRSAPVVSRKIILPFPSPNTAWGAAILLPGGKYVFFLHATLDCWSVAEERVIWTLRSRVQSAPSAFLRRFTVQTTDVPDQVVILSCYRVGVAADSRKNFVEVTTLDLNSRTSHSLLVMRVPDTSDDTPYAQPTICGDVAAVTVRTEVILINWRTGSCVMIQIHGKKYMGFNQFCRLALAPRYAVLVLPLPPGPSEEHEERAVVISLSELPWAPVDAAHTPSRGIIDALELSPVSDERIPFDGQIWTYNLQLAVHESPVQRGLFRVWIHLAGNGGVSLFSFTLDLRGETPDWRHRATMLARDPQVRVAYWGVPFSGHTVEWTETSGQLLAVVPPVSVVDDDEVHKPVELDGQNHGNGHVSAYTGALTYSTRNSLFVLYYD